MPADYDGDGCIDIAIWRPSTGQWLIRDQSVIQWVGIDVNARTG